VVGDEGGHFYFYNKKMDRVIGRLRYCHFGDVYFMFLCMGYFEWVSGLFAGRED
jgi:hypothetical protein